MDLGAVTRMDLDESTRTNRGEATRTDGREATRTDGRAQTTLDFAIGASTFLIVVVFVVAFLPGMMTPFEDVDPTQAADRFAESLSGDVLGHPADGNRLNETCTAAFFRQLEQDEPKGADCRFDEGATTPAEALATDHVVNVTIEPRSVGGSPPSLSYDGTSVTPAAGPDPDGIGTVTVARRIVLLDDGTGQQRTYRLVVRVW
ncbi:DUF7287 family protein [Halopenitus persicus]|uniref:Uncharacterized protein n=1 Tax=Halopenitus persicus TaxID=1048396 RepID=A0A1H3HDF1_9EURY|nr:hypothetical protein [Halopenitus persicus]SDY13492.1 hypothetical protein SAMN05216564_103231 [Halopenitus persicus]